MSNWNDNRAKDRKTGGYYRRKARPGPGVVVDKSPPEQRTPVAVDWPDTLAVDVFHDRTRDSEDVRWLLALGVAIVGACLITIGIGSDTVYHQIFWAIILLTLVVAIKR